MFKIDPTKAATIGAANDRRARIGSHRKLPASAVDLRNMDALEMQTHVNSANTLPELRALVHALAALVLSDIANREYPE